MNDRTERLKDINKPFHTSGDVQCNKCWHWEEAMGLGSTCGYCPVFDKVTERDHGDKCTAFYDGPGCRTNI